MSGPRPRVASGRAGQWGCGVPWPLRAAPRAPPAGVGAWTPVPAGLSALRGGRRGVPVGRTVRLWRPVALSGGSEPLGLCTGLGPRLSSEELRTHSGCGPHPLWAHRHPPARGCPRRCRPRPGARRPAVRMRPVYAHRPLSPVLSLPQPGSHRTASLQCLEAGLPCSLWESPGDVRHGGVGPTLS